MKSKTKKTVLKAKKVPKKPSKKFTKKKFLKKRSKHTKKGGMKRTRSAEDTQDNITAKKSKTNKWRKHN